MPTIDIDLSAGMLSYNHEQLLIKLFNISGEFRTFWQANHIYCVEGGTSIILKHCYGIIILRDEKKIKSTRYAVIGTDRVKNTRDQLYFITKTYILKLSLTTLRLLTNNKKNSNWFSLVKIEPYAKERAIALKKKINSIQATDASLCKQLTKVIIKHVIEFKHGDAKKISIIYNARKRLLSEVIDKDEPGKNLLSLAHRFNLSYELLMAYQKQILEKNICHGNVTANNVVVDIFHVKYLNQALSTQQLSYINCNDVINYRFDILNLGYILAALWQSFIPGMSPDHLTDDIFLEPLKTIDLIIEHLTAYNFPAQPDSLMKKAPLKLKAENYIVNAILILISPCKDQRTNANAAHKDRIQAYSNLFRAIQSLTFAQRLQAVTNDNINFNPTFFSRLTAIMPNNSDQLSAQKYECIN